MKERDDDKKRVDEIASMLVRHAGDNTELSNLLDDQGFFSEAQEHLTRAVKLAEIARSLKLPPEEDINT